MEQVLDRLFAEEMLVVWSLLGSLLGTLIVLAATLWAGAQVTEQARALWRALRGQRGAVIGAVDEPTDPAIRVLADVSKIPAAVWAAVLPAFVAALVDALDRAAGQ